MNSTQVRAEGNGDYWLIESGIAPGRAAERRTYDERGRSLSCSKGLRIRGARESTRPAADLTRALR